MLTFVSKTCQSGTVVSWIEVLLTSMLVKGFLHSIFMLLHISFDKLFWSSFLPNRVVAKIYGLDRCFIILDAEVKCTQFQRDWESNWPKGKTFFFSVMRSAWHPSFAPLLLIVNLDTHFVPLLIIEWEWKVRTFKSETFTSILISPTMTIAIAAIFYYSL